MSETENEGLVCNHCTLYISEENPVWHKVDGDVGEELAFHQACYKEWCEQEDIPFEDEPEKEEVESVLPKPVGSFSMRIDMRLWKNIVDISKLIFDEMPMKVTKEGITMKGLDPSHVSMLDINIPKVCFDEYEVDADDVLDVDVNTEEFSKFLRKPTKDETLEMSYTTDEERLRLVTRSKRYEREFEMPVLESYTETPPDIKIELTAKVKMLGSVLQEALSDILSVGDYMIATHQKPLFTLSTSGSDYGGSMTIKVDEESEGVLSFYESTEETRSGYSVDAILDIVKAMKSFSDLVLWEFTTNRPLRMSVDGVNGLKIAYYLAPRIDTDELE